MRAATGALFAVAACASPLAAQTPSASGTTLTVNATGEARRVPDLVTLTAGVVSQAPSAQAAFSASAATLRRVVAALRQAGVPERDIATADASLAPQYRYGSDQPPTLTGYQANAGVTVRLRDVARSGTVIDALVAAGANSVNGPTLSVAEPAAALDEARLAALATARARAALYARAAGLQVKRIVEVSEEGRQQFVPVERARVALAQAGTEIAPGEQGLQVNLRVVFELQ